MAGGLLEYSIKQAHILSLLAGGWVGVIAAGVLTELYSAFACGFGPRGFYYNAVTSHEGVDSFAVDFTSYRRFLPYNNISQGTPVLAPASGVVVGAVGTRPTGNPISNTVEIMHPSGVQLDRYLSRYLHLDGPFQLNVFTGMDVKTGQRLGLMDDTGNSAIHHLHFSIHDQNDPYPGSTPSPSSDSMIAPGRSVRPSPMDGKILDDFSGDATCILSTNREFIPPPPDEAEFVTSQIPSTIQPLQFSTASITVRNTGTTIWPIGYKLVFVLPGWNLEQIAIDQRIWPGDEKSIHF